MKFAKITLLHGKWFRVGEGVGTETSYRRPLR